MQNSQQKELTLKSGDIILGNWITVLGRLSTLGGQRWGHIALVVRISSELCVYEISVVSGKPIIVPLTTYLADPLLHELTVRQLKVQLTAHQEEEYKEMLLAHQNAHYPALAKLFKRLAGHPPEMETEHMCSELVYSIIRLLHARLNGKAPHKWERFNPGMPILPDAFVPGNLPLVDDIYEPTLKLIVKREVSKEQRRAMLEPQLIQLAHHIA